jgi:hypothetical protein
MDNKKHPADTSKPKEDIMKLAKGVRSAANAMTDVQREDSFRHGMQLIYGGGSRGITAKTSRP